MDERGQGVPAYIPVLLLVGLVAAGAVVVAGPSLGGLPGEVHAALRAMLVNDEWPVVDHTAPVVPPETPIAPSLVAKLPPVPAVEPVFIIPLGAVTAT